MLISEIKLKDIDYKTFYCCGSNDEERYIKRFYSLLNGFSDTFGKDGDIRLFPHLGVLK